MPTYHSLIKMHAPWVLFVIFLTTIFTPGVLPPVVEGTINLPFPFGIEFPVPVDNPVIVFLYSSMIIGIFISPYLIYDYSKFYPKSLDFFVKFDSFGLNEVIRKDFKLSSQKDMEGYKIQPEFDQSQRAFFERLNEELLKFKQGHVEIISNHITEEYIDFQNEKSRLEAGLISILSDKKLLPGDNFFSADLSFNGNVEMKIKKEKGVFHSYQLEECSGNLVHDNPDLDQRLRSHFKLKGNVSGPHPIRPSLKNLLSGCMVVKPEFELRLQHYSSHNLHAPIILHSFFKVRIWPYTKLYRGLYCCEIEEGLLAPVGYAIYAP